jgi:hypothetical protein
VAFCPSQATIKRWWHVGKEGGEEGVDPVQDSGSVDSMCGKVREKHMEAEELWIQRAYEYDSKGVGEGVEWRSTWSY